MAKWIKVDNPVIDIPKGASYLVCLEKALLGSRLQVAEYFGTIVVGGIFHFDAPKITHYMELPDLPDDA